MNFKAQFLGWILYIIASVFFLIVNWMHDDVVSIIFSGLATTCGVVMMIHCYKQYFSHSS